MDLEALDLDWVAGIVREHQHDIRVQSISGVPEPSCPSAAFAKRQEVLGSVEFEKFVGVLQAHTEDVRAAKQRAADMTEEDRALLDLALAMRHILLRDHIRIFKHKLGVA